MKDYLIILYFTVFALSNVLGFLFMGIDKRRAKRNMRRIPEKTLFLFAILLGGIGSSLGMYTFRHKTKHWYFKVFFPLLAVLQLALTVYVYMI